MLENLVALDIEISAIIPEGADWDLYRPFGISCVGLSTADKPRIVYAKNNKLSPKEIDGLVAQLRNIHEIGSRFVTWNGLRFDFSVLAEESGEYHLFSEIALNHYDLMFQLYNQLGYPVGLDATAKGFGLSGKYQNISGAMVPILWSNGERQRVFDYLSTDIDLTLLVAKNVERENEFRWQTKNGKLRTVKVERLKTVREVLEENPPQVPAWWKGPSMNRQDFMQWVV